MRAKKVSTDAGKSSRQGDHNFTQVSLTCSHAAALVPVPTSHVSRTILRSSRRVCTAAHRTRSGGLLLGWGRPTFPEIFSEICHGGE